MERRKTESLKKLLDQVTAGVRDADVVSTIAGRLARLDRVISGEDRAVLAEAADGMGLTDLVRVLGHRRWLDRLRDPYRQASSSHRIHHGGSGGSES